MFITLDIGGTKCRMAEFARLSKDQIQGVRTIPIENNWDVDFGRIVMEVESLKQERKIEGMAIGIAGALRKDKKFLTNSVNLSTWENINIKKAFADRFKSEVYLENDTFMAGFGEGYYGKVRKDFLYINWGTGVGGCLVNFKEDNSGKRKKGSVGKKNSGDKINIPLDIRATELGHQVIVSGGIKCRCGQKGCLDAYVGGRGIQIVYGKQAVDLTQKEWKEVVERMAFGLINALVVYPVEYLVMGGGIALNQFDKVKHMEEIINKKIKIIPPPKIRFASLDDYAGLYGCLAYLGCVCLPESFYTL